MQFIFEGISREALSCEVRDIKSLRPDMLQGYDVIIHGIDYSRLSLIHRMMMGMLCQTMKKKGYDNLSDEDKLMLVH